MSLAVRLHKYFCCCMQAKNDDFLLTKCTFTFPNLPDTTEAENNRQNDVFMQRNYTGNKLQVTLQIKVQINQLLIGLKGDNSACSDFVLLQLMRKNNLCISIELHVNQGVTIT